MRFGRGRGEWAGLPCGEEARERGALARGVVVVEGSFRLEDTMSCIDQYLRARGEVSIQRWSATSKG